MISANENAVRVDEQITYDNETESTQLDLGALQHTELHPDIERQDVNTASALTHHEQTDKKKNPNLLKANHISDDRIMKLAERNKKKAQQQQASIRVTADQKKLLKFKN